MDLIPVVSFVLLKGKCRYCEKKISIQYPLVETATAALFALTTQHYLQALPGYGGQNIIELLLIFGSVASLLAIFVFDLKYYLIPDVLVLAGLICAIVWRFFFLEEILPEVFGAVIVSGFFGLMYFLSQGKWIGLGDVKLGIFLGFFLGAKLSLVMLLVAYVSGALVGVVLILLKKRTLAGILPFGTFLTLSTFIVYLWGQSILDWYLNLL